MLCSIDSTGAAMKSGGSTWLDRLRSNKGFPTTSEDNLDLDHFLGAAAAAATHCNDNVDRVTVSQRNRNQNGESRCGPSHGSVMSNVLCELFNMGEDFDGIQKKKSLRKQTNPKFCSVWDSSVRRNENVQGDATSASDNDVNLARVERERVGVEVEEEEEEEKELFGFSRSEVTVIDTSFAVWKFDKVLVRKKNVWKVRDKKGGGSASKSSTILARKNKRKFAAAAAAASASNDHNVNVVDSNKKPKVCPPEFYSQNSQDQKKGHVCKATPNDHLSQVSYLRIPRKSRKGCSSSSNILIRGIPTSKNNEVRVVNKGQSTSMQGLKLN